MRPFRSALPVAITLAGLALASSAQAARLGGTAAAGATSWAGYRWQTTSRYGHVGQTPAALHIRLGAAGPASLYVNYTTVCTIAPPFAVEVHYGLTTWPAANGTRVGILVDDPSDPQAAVTTERTSFGNEAGGPGEKYIQNASDVASGLTIQPTAATTGTLRVVDLDGMLTSRYRDATTGGVFLVIHNAQGHQARAPDFGAPVTLGLQVWAAAPVYAGPTVVTLSRFEITQGHCS